MDRLEDKVALITGAGSGIGGAAALLFAREGAKVVINDINREMAHETLREVSAESGTAIAAVGDVSNPAESSDVVRQTVQAFGRLDILYNNAGINPRGQGGWDCHRTRYNRMGPGARGGSERRHACLQGGDP